MDISKLLMQKPIPLYTVVSREKDKNPNCYFIDQPQFEPYKSDTFIANVAQGGSVNCEYIRFCAHGNGTHTECFGHVSKQFYSVQNVKIPFLMLAQMVTVTVDINPIEQEAQEFMREHQQTLNALGKLVGLESEKKKSQKKPLYSLEELPFHTIDFSRITALIIRINFSLEFMVQNNLDRKNFSGKNPPFFTPSLIRYLKSKGIQHLLTNLPSIDPENDNGKLEAHLAFWGMENRESIPLYPNDTITEFCSIPDHVKDGLYWLHLGLSPFESDAVPSMPVLFPVSDKI